VFYAAGPPETQLSCASRVAVVGGGNSAGQAAVWLARDGTLVMLLHRRADLRETMSDYLVRELGRLLRDRSEIAAAKIGVEARPRRSTVSKATSASARRRLAPRNSSSSARASK